MANRYGIYGAATNGDGTASNEAASDGAAGAWKLDQAAGDILQGTPPTYGTLAAGDVVYIRSKTGNGANADKTITQSAAVTLGSASATSASPITWILDNGTVWSGITGTLTFSKANGYAGYLTTFRDYNIFIAKTPDSWVVIQTTTGNGSVSFATIGTGTIVEGILFDTTIKTGTGNYAAFTTLNQAAVAKNCHWKCGTVATGVIALSSYERATLVNPQIELTLSGAPSAIIKTASYPCFITVLGGRIYGAGVTTGHALFDGGGTSSGLSTLVLGMDIPKAVRLTSAVATAGNVVASAFGCDKSAGGEVAADWGRMSSRRDIMPPTLNATFPDSVSTPWSWWLYPEVASRALPASLALGKLYTASPATKTITLEVLVADTLALNASTLWMDVVYWDDDTGLPVLLSTFDATAGALTTSSAAWSATSYGSVTFDKIKLAVTTTSNIKQDTMVSVLVNLVTPSATADDILIICPDPQLT